MARGINKVILVGNIGQDPEIRYMPAGGAVANITVATSDSWMDKASGERRDRTEWHRVVLFNRLAEICGEYVKKGQQVYLEGRLQTRKWTDQSGADRYTTEIVANEMQMLGSRSGGSSAPYAEGEAYSQAPSAPPRPAAPPQNAAPAPRAPQQPPAAPQDAFPDFEDDIPF